MPELADLWRYLLIWTLVGILAFNVYVVLVFRTGLVYSARQPDGTLKERIPLSGLVNMALLLVLIIGLQMAANGVGLARRGLALSWNGLYLLNLAHYLLLFLYDTLVIDWLVIGVWRPDFLRLPEAMGRESMSIHLRSSLVVGPLAGLVLCALSTLLSYWLFFTG